MRIEVEKSCHSAWEDLRGAIDELEALAEAVGLPQHDVESFSLALWEALANALKHGTRGRQDARIWLRYAIEPGRLWARVRDEGEGFDMSTVPDPRTAAGLLSASGRGILIMRNLCDKVEWSRGGTEVCLLRQRSLPRAVRFPSRGAGQAQKSR